jgi:tetratricopeptide (TPR) repeat protein
MSKRLTRKQIKEDIRHDEVQTALSATYDQVRSHQRLVIGVVAAVVAAALGFAAVRAYAGYRGKAAAGQLSQAIKIYGAPIRETGAKPDDPRTPSFASEDDREARAREALEAVAGGKAEDVAALYLADLAVRDGDKAAARKYWEAFLREHEDDILAVSVRLNLLRLDREEGKVEEVARQLEAELEKTKKTLPEDVILFELAKTLDALDRGEEAKDYYQRILDDHPQSPYSAKAREMTSSS